MRTISRIRINEHDSAEELSSYTEPDSLVFKRESSPWYPTGKFKDQKEESEKNDTNAATDSEAHASSDILNISDFPPIIEAGTKAILWEEKSGDRKRKLHGEDTSNQENVLELTSSSDAESFPMAVALNSTPPPGCMSPLPIKRKASIASITSDDEERKDRYKRLRPIVHQHFHLPGEWAAVNIYVTKRSPKIKVDGVSIHDLPSTIDG